MCETKQSFLSAVLVALHQFILHSHDTSIITNFAVVSGGGIMRIVCNYKPQNFFFFFFFFFFFLLAVPTCCFCCNSSSFVIVLIIQTQYSIRRDHDLDLDHQNGLVNKTTFVRSLFACLLSSRFDENFFPRCLYAQA